MSLILRDYQEEAVQKTVSYFLNKSIKTNQVIVGPVGCGKALIIAESAERLGSQVLCLCPNASLVQQNYDEYMEQTGLTNCAIYCAGLDSKEIGEVTFATINSVKNNPNLFKDFKYCIIDECDLVSPEEKSMYNKFFKEIKIKKCLGLTGTPIRVKNAEIKNMCKMSPRFFSGIIYHIPVKKMVDNGYWSPLKYVQYNFDKSRLSISGNEYSTKSMSKALKKQQVNNNAYILCKRLMSKGTNSILLFVDNVSIAKKFEEVLPNCRAVTHDTPKKERIQIESDFKSGKVKVLVNYGTYTEGFNFPSLEYVILARPTLSVRLYIQMLGRIVRKHKDKKEGVVVDFCKNVQMFGKLEDIDMIELEDNPKDKKISGWQMCSGEKLITGINVRDIGRYLINTSTKKIKFIKGRKNSTYQLKVGNKYQGRQLRFVPMYYLEFIKEKFDNPPKEVLEYLE